MQIFGWFDSPGEIPAFDPGIDVPCPFCLTMLGRPMVTISLMKDGDNKNYFFRAHKKCHEGATDEQRNQIEWSLIDASSGP